MATASNNYEGAPPPTLTSCTAVPLELEENHPRNQDVPMDMDTSYPETNCMVNLQNLEHPHQHYDAAIIHSNAERDMVTAEVLKERLNMLDLSTGHRPKVALYSELVDASPGGAGDVYEDVLKRVTLVMVLITPDLINDQQYRNLTLGIFTRFLQQNGERRACFIPVYRSDPRYLDFVPLVLRNAKGFNLENIDSEEKVMARTFEFHLHKRLRREEMEFANRY